jgi:glycosyltransferase involved in cell wall biosynthesis
MGKNPMQSSEVSKKTVILVDAVSSVLGGGVTFNVCLINAMAKIRPEYQFYVIAGSQAFVDQLAHESNISAYLIPGRSNFLWRFLWRQLVLPWQAFFCKADAVIAQFPGIFLSFRPQVMLVLNSHYLMEPPIAKNAVKAFKCRIMRYLYILGYRHVDKAVFLSHQMAALTLRWTGPDKGKNKVIYEAADPAILAWYQKQQVSNSAGEPYFIAVGSVSYHKNYRTMLEAFAQLVKEFPNPIRLKIAGYFRELNDYKAGRGKIPDLVTLTQKLGIEDRVDWLGEIFSQDLYKLLHDSIAFVSTSLLEAYPLTAIEAMAAGTPVIVPNTTSYPEVVGEAGLYHNPEAPSSVCEQMLKLVQQPEVRRKYLELARQKSTLFSWENSAIECFALIDDIVGK